jgi:phenylalanyl-tRNA synthetase alpha chain
MLERIKELKKEIEEIVANSIEEAESLRIKYLSKKGEISKLFEEFRNVSAEQKKEIGRAVNTLKEFAQEKINLLK